MAGYFGFRSAQQSSASLGADTSRASPSASASLTPTSEKSASPVTLGDLLSSNNNDPLTALAKLVSSYNDLLATHSGTSSLHALQSERDVLAADNANLRAWYSQMKKEQERGAKETKESRARIAELEGMLRDGHLATPSPRSASHSPMDELNVPRRPRPSRSFSDEPLRSPHSAATPSDTSRKAVRTPDGSAIPPSLSDYAFGQIQGSTHPSLHQEESAEEVAKSSNPVPTGALKHNRAEELARKASSQDVGNRAPVGTEGRSLRTPPLPDTPSSGMWDGVDTNRANDQRTPAAGYGQSIPNAPSSSPLWAPNTPSRSESIPKEGLGITSSSSQSVMYDARHQGLSDALGAMQPASGVSSALGTGKQRESPLIPAVGDDHPSPVLSKQDEHRPSVSQPRGGHSKERRPPTLTPSMLAYLTIRVLTSSIKLDARGRENVSFSLHVCLQTPPEHDSHRTGNQVRWLIEKIYADILLLDSAVRAKNGKAQAKKLAPVPDKSLFKDHAPTKVDQRKIALQIFLNTLLTTPLQDRADICTFFSTNFVSERSLPISSPAHKAGHLTKKGRSFGGWQTRYYVLNGPGLDYYESVRLLHDRHLAQPTYSMQQGGLHLGSINLVGAQIGRQQNHETSTPDSYRHAFLIREKAVGKDSKSSKQEEHDHILCAESDGERDEWVRVLAAWYSGEYTESAETLTSKQTNEEPPTWSSEDPASGTNATVARGQGASPVIYGQHERQHSPGHIWQTSMGETERQRAAGYLHQNSQHDQGQPHDISASLSAPSALSELASARHAPIPTTFPNRAAVSTSLSTDLQVHHRSASHTLLQGIPDETRRPPYGNTEHSNSPDRQRIDSDHSQAGKRGISGPTNAVPIGDGHTFKQALHPRKDEERRARAKSSFWGFAKSDRRENSGPPPVPRPVFGIPLAEAVAIARVRDDFELPAVVYRCVEYLEAKAAQTEEGIYRLSGSNNVIKQLKDRFDHEGDINLLGCGDYYDVHAIAGLLKLYLRELPVHVLTRELQPHFFSVTDEGDRATKVNKLGLLVGQLPTPNYTLLRFLTAHLIHVVQNENINKMSLRNIGIVFNPTLRIPAQLFSLLLTEFDLIFAMEGDQPAPGKVDGELVPESPTEVRSRRRSRNSMIYEASGADQLLEQGGRLAIPTEEDEADPSGKVIEHLDEGMNPATFSEDGSPVTSYDARQHPYQARGKDLGLQIKAGASPIGPGLPASPRSPLQGAQTALSVAKSPGLSLPASPRHVQRV